MSERNIDAFCIDHKEKILYAANKLGEVLCIDIDSFSIKNRIQLHAGSISAITIHEKFNYLAAYSNDGYISISKVDGEKLSLLHMIKVRDVKPEFDFFRRGPSVAHAVAFHPQKLRLASRGGTAGVLELEFDETGYKILHCTRMHDNHDLFIVRYLGDGDKLISGGNAGGGTALSENGKIIDKWFHRESLHWYEPLGEGIFLVASDSMRVLRMNFYNDKENMIGPLISRDHLEHVTYNKSTRKAYTSAFDRKITEIDPLTCEKVRLVWTAPFKCRWIKTLERDPSIMIVQCRNGGLYKIDIEAAKILSVIKETPHAQWTAAVSDNEIIISGEGNKYEVYSPLGNHPILATTLFSVEEKNLTKDAYTYTKRLCTKDGYVAFGRTSGEILLKVKDTIKLLCQLNSPVRDIAFYKRSSLFIACEDGSLYKVKIPEGKPELIYKTELPIWSLAVNEERGLVAFANRLDKLYLYDANSNKTIEWTENFSYSKRMKWKDADTLLFVGGEILYEIKLGCKNKSVVVAFKNTIEDFDWDINKRYLVVISYARYVYLCDYDTGEVLDESGDGADYSKGILFLNQKFSNYPTDFIVFGRAGMPSYNRVHDDRIIHYGFINNKENAS